MNVPEKRGQRPPLRVVLAALMLLVGVFALAACGDDDSDGDDGGVSTGDAALAEMTDATLVLDFVPNAVHTGIYCAVGRGYYDENNINLEIIEPTSTADTLKLIDAGKAQFGIADGIDVADQITQGRGAQGIMALVQRPLGGLITLESAGITDPAQLEGKTVGVTGVPSDDAILDTVITDAGGDPSNIEVVTIGFNGVQNLENEKVDAFTGFTAADGTQIEVDGFPITSFALDEYGGPQYPGLVVFSTEDTISHDPELMAAFVDATVRGYEDTLANPEECLDELLSENAGLQRELQQAQLDAYEPLFVANAPSYGVFQEENIAALSAFLVDTGLADEEIAVDRYATNEFVPTADGGE
jgi:NitT/TauT family transport system substrate-binding protein/putative hydroxymethylpyrimidine transport system substrate-binding protein